MSKQHALLSASGASRWINCPPSARLEEQFPSSTRSYAEEGTLAHELAELKLTRFIEPMSPRTYTTRLNKLKKNELWDKEMEKHTEKYMDYIKRVAMSCPTNPIIQAETKLDFSQYVPEGFGTADCIILDRKTLYIIDFKYGQGVAVSAKENSQMKLYAIGAYLKYRVLYTIDTVKMAVIQPRKYDAPLEYEMPISDLLSWADSVVEIANLAINGGGDFKAGDHCQFCRAKAQCRERADMNLKLAQHEFKKPPLLTDEEVGDILKKSQDLAKWAEDLKTYALSASLQGKIIPGWKAVTGKSSGRTFKDTEEAINLIISNGTSKEMLYKREQLSLAQIEKLLGKKEFESVVGDLVEKLPGSPTLVEESDERERVTNKSTAVEDFGGDNNE